MLRQFVSLFSNDVTSESSVSVFRNGVLITSSLNGEPFPNPFFPELAENRVDAQVQGFAIAILIHRELQSHLLRNFIRESLHVALLM